MAVFQGMCFTSDDVGSTDWGGGTQHLLWALAQHKPKKTHLDSQHQFLLNLQEEKQTLPVLLSYRELISTSLNARFIV